MLCSTVQHCIIGIPCEGYTGVVATHPFIHAMMQEQVSQQRADNTSLGRSFPPFFPDSLPINHLSL
jgi:hypothetical protein